MIESKKLLNLSKKQLDEGINLEEAMSALSDYAGDVRMVMVWSQSTKRKLELLVNKYGYKKLIRNVIVLQDVLMEHMQDKNAISFDNALIAMEINYDPRHMHNAVLDAKHIKELFVKTCRRIEELNPALQDGVYKLNDSKKYHTAGCACLRRSVKENEKLDYKEILGLVPCKRCIGDLNQLILDIDSNKEIKRIKKIKGYKHKAVNCEQMYEIADFFGLNISGNMNMATVNTGYSFWKVFCNNKGYAIKLKHENYTVRDRSGRTYHNHDEFPKDIFHNQVTKRTKYHGGVYGAGIRMYM